MTVIDDYKTSMDAVYFGDIPAFKAFIEEEFGPEECSRMFGGRSNHVDIAMTYYPDINEYMGRESIQMVVTGYCRI